MFQSCRCWPVLVLVLVVIAAGCPQPNDPADPDPDPEIDYRDEMRSFVTELADYARGFSAGFIVIAQNGPELLTTDGEADGPLSTDYAVALDGLGQEHPFYGQDAYNTATKKNDRNYYLDFLDRAESEGIEVLVTDYCNVPALVLDAYARSANRGYIHFAAPNPSYDLDSIPVFPGAPFGANDDAIETLADARNFLYVIDSEPFGSPAGFVAAVQATNYDILIMDPFHDGTAFTADQIAAIHTKANGGTRLVIAYVNVGAAENWRYYWDNQWETGDPEWIDEEYEGYPDEHWVRYWDSEWKDIVFGNDTSYVKRVLDAGFDGVYLDNILAFEFFEGQN